MIVGLISPGGHVACFVPGVQGSTLMNINFICNSLTSANNTNRMLSRLLKKLNKGKKTLLGTNTFRNENQREGQMNIIMYIQMYIQDVEREENKMKGERERERTLTECECIEAKKYSKKERELHFPKNQRSH